MADEWKDCVRLYFHPRTPTQHQVEGFRPAGGLGSLGKHMPVPIFLLFDAKEILTRKTTRFSTGNLSQNPPVGEDAAFFESIPFEKIYHDSWMREEEKSEIKFHRHAEIIVSHELDLDGLRRIWCRSEAEYQTLLHLLPRQLAKKFRGSFMPLLKELGPARWAWVSINMALLAELCAAGINPTRMLANPLKSSRNRISSSAALRSGRTGESDEWRPPLEGELKVEKKTE